MSGSHVLPKIIYQEVCKAVCWLIFDIFGGLWQIQQIELNY